MLHDNFAKLLYPKNIQENAESELYDLNGLKLSAEKVLNPAALSEPEHALPGLQYYCFAPTTAKYK